MVTVFHHTPVNAVLFLNNFDVIKFDSLAGKRQNFLPSKFCAIQYMDECTVFCEDSLYV